MKTLLATAAAAIAIFAFMPTDANAGTYARVFCGYDACGRPVYACRYVPRAYCHPGYNYSPRYRCYSGYRYYSPSRCYTAPRPCHRTYSYSYCRPRPRCW